MRIGIGITIFAAVFYLATVGFASTNIISTFTAPDQPAATASISTMPHVPDNATLLTKATTAYPNGVWRMDFASGSGAPPLFYQPKTSCPYTVSGAGDNGGCVEGTDGKWFVAQFGDHIDIREFGAITTASNAAPQIQSAFNAAKYLGTTSSVCGGVFTITQTVYYYYDQHYSFCPGGQIKQGAANFAMLAPSDAVGHTYVQAALKSTKGAEFSGLNLDRNFQCGTGIILQATRHLVIDPGWQVINAPSPCTFNYTDNAGTGSLPSAGVLGLNGNVDQLEHLYIGSGIAGNDAYVVGGGSWSTCGHQGDVGIKLTNIPWWQFYANPANQITIEHVSAYCMAGGVIQDDYGSDNRFIDDDGTVSGTYGISVGTVGKYDLTVGGTVTTGDVIGVNFYGPLGSPIQPTYTAVGGDTTVTMATGLAAAINANSTLTAYGVAATASNSNVIVTYGTTTILLMTLSATPGGTGHATLATAHPAQRDVIISLYAENTNLGIAAYIGPNVAQLLVKDTGSISGETTLMRNLNGAYNVRVENFTQGVQGGRGTYRNFAGGSTQTVDCLNDPQPEMVDTTGGAIRLNITGTHGYGTQCTFLDYNGTFGTNHLTLGVTSSWDSVEGSTLTLSTSYQSLSLTLNSAFKWVPSSFAP